MEENVTLKEFIKKMLLEAFDDDKRLSWKGDFPAQHLERLKKSKEIEDAEKEKSFEKSREEALELSATMPMPKMVFDSKRAERTLKKYEYSEGNIDALAAKLRAKTGKQTQTGPDIITKANGLAKQIAEKGRTSPFVFYSVVKSKQIKGEKQVENLESNIKDAIKMSSQKDFFSYVLEVLVSAYNGKSTFDNGFELDIEVAEEKDENGKVLKTKTTTKSSNPTTVTIKSSKNDILAAISAFFAVEPKSRELGEGFKTGPFEAYLTKVIETRTKGAMSIQEIKMKTSEAEFREATMYAWMKIFGAADLYEKEIEDEVAYQEAAIGKASDATLKSIKSKTKDEQTAEEKEILALGRMKTISKSDGLRNITNGSFFYYAILGMSSNIINYFIIKSLKSQVERLSATHEDVFEPGNESEDVDTILKEVPNIHSIISEIIQKILPLATGEKQNAALQKVLLERTPATEYFINLVKESTSEYVTLSTMYDLEKFKNLVVDKAGENGILEFNEANSKAQSEQSFDPIYELSEKYEIKLPRRANYMAELEAIAREKNLLFKSKGDITATLSKFLKGQEVQEALKKEFMKYPFFTEETVDYDEKKHEYSTKYSLKIDPISFLSSSVLSKQKGTDFGSKFLDTQKDKYARFKSSEYQMKMAKQREKGEFDTGTSISDFDKSQMNPVQGPFSDKEQIQNALKAKREVLVNKIKQDFIDREGREPNPEELRIAFKDFKEKYKSEKLQQFKDKETLDQIRDENEIDIINNFKAEHGREPNEEEIQKAVLDIKGKGLPPNFRAPLSNLEELYESIIDEVLNLLI